jgi:hypothetical protein
MGQGQAEGGEAKPRGEFQGEFVLANKSRLRGSQANASSGHRARLALEPPCPITKHPGGLRIAEKPSGPGDLRGTGKVRIYSPALAAVSTKVPLPWLWKRKLGPFSLSQKISEALLLRMGPTLTPRPARRRGAPTVNAWCPPTVSAWCPDQPRHQINYSKETIQRDLRDLTFGRLPTELDLSSQSP